MSVEEVVASLLGRFLREMSSIGLKKFCYKLKLRGGKRKRVQRLLFGVVSHLILVDWIMSRIGAPRDEWERNLLRVIIYRLAVERNREVVRRLDGVCGFDLEELARRVDEILAEVERLRGARKLSLKYSFPEWLVERLLEYMPESKVREVLAGLNQRTPTWAIVNTRKIDRDELIDLLSREGFECLPDDELDDVIMVVRGGEKLEQSTACRLGLLLIADKASAVVVHVLDPRPGESILDMCSAPGVKLIHASFRMGEGRIVAVDISEKRVARMRELIARYGVDDVIELKVLVKDARKLTEDEVGEIDKILLDPECTSTGVVPRSPDVKLRVTPERLREMVELQWGLLSHAVKLGRRCGARVLVYSVCSVTPDEGELIIERAVRELGVRVCDVPYGSEAYIPGLGVRLFPHIHKTLGFFISKLRLD